MRVVCVLAFTLILIVGMVLYVKHDVTSGNGLPDGATDITEVGGDWFEFTYKGKRILFHHPVAYRESMVVIGENYAP